MKILLINILLFLLLSACGNKGESTKQPIQSEPVSCQPAADPNLVRAPAANQPTQLAGVQ